MDDPARAEDREATLVATLEPETVQTDPEGQPVASATTKTFDAPMRPLKEAEQVTTLRREKTPRALPALKWTETDRADNEVSWQTVTRKR